MKKKLKIALCIFLCVAIVSGATVFILYQLKLKEYKNMTINLPENFTYTAHTGCNGTEDNSLESIEVAVEHGAHIVEFDIYYNGTEFVLSHDAPKGGEVTLREAFLKLKEYDGLRANVDVKDTTEIGKVQTLAEELEVLDRIFFTGVTIVDVGTVSENCPDIPYYLNMEVIKPDENYDNYLKAIIKKVKDYGAIGINFNKNAATAELVEAFHAEGLLVSIWTVSNELEIYEILSYRPDNITTRRPDLLKEALAEVGE